ncbi:hypothetical protein J6590_061362 [Homalodisca vitripennis]|nr:hypothetical protein J6590_061362 [Homalodisca vitripennis]
MASRKWPFGHQLPQVGALSAFLSVPGFVNRGVARPHQSPRLPTRIKNWRVLFRGLGPQMFLLAASLLRVAYNPQCWREVPRDRTSFLRLPGQCSRSPCGMGIPRSSHPSSPNLPTT